MRQKEAMDILYKNTGLVAVCDRYAMDIDGSKYMLPMKDRVRLAEVEYTGIGKPKFLKFLKFTVSADTLMRDWVVMDSYGNIVEGVDEIRYGELYEMNKRGGKTIVLVVETTRNGAKTVDLDGNDGYIYPRNLPHVRKVSVEELNSLGEMNIKFAGNLLFTLLERKFKGLPRKIGFAIEVSDTKKSIIVTGGEDLDGTEVESTQKRLGLSFNVNGNTKTEWRANIRGGRVMQIRFSGVGAKHRDLLQVLDGITVAEIGEVEEGNNISISNGDIRKMKYNGDVIIVVVKAVRGSNIEVASLCGRYRVIDLKNASDVGNVKKEEIVGVRAFSTEFFAELLSLGLRAQFKGDIEKLGYRVEAQLAGNVVYVKRKISDGERILLDKAEFDGYAIEYSDKANKELYDFGEGNEGIVIGEGRLKFNYKLVDSIIKHIRIEEDIKSVKKKLRSAEEEIERLKREIELRDKKISSAMEAFGMSSK